MTNYKWDKKDILKNLKNLKKELKKENNQTIKLAIKSYKELLNKLYLPNINIQKTNFEIDEDLIEIAYINYLNTLDNYPYLLEKNIIEELTEEKEVKTKTLNTKYKNNNSLIIECYNFFENLDEDFKNIYEKLLKTNKIYLKRSKNNECFCLLDKINKQAYIYTETNEEEKDLFSLTHEVAHAIQGNFNDFSYNQTQTDYVTAEVISILSSFLLNDFLNTEESNNEINNIQNKMARDIKILNNQLILFENFVKKQIKLDEFNIIFKNLNLEEKNRMLLGSYQQTLKYTYSYKIAKKFFKQYKNNKSSFLKNIKNFMIETPNKNLDELLIYSKIKR